MVDPCSVLLNDAVSVVDCPAAPSMLAIEFTDEWLVGGNGIEKISLSFDRTDFEWKWPEADLMFGLASGFRILTADRADGVFTERALVGADTYTDNSGDPPIGGCLFYRIVATNAAGDAQQ